jgi:uncharacterized surface protein with fasciclin (FAS1) repeats
MTTTRAFLTHVVLAVCALALVGHAFSASVPVSSPAIDQLEKTDWTRGRMTFYGKDGYSIHDGACHYGGIPHPYYVAALSDWWPEYRNGAYEHNKCGHCFEIQCDPNGRSYCRNDRLNASIIVRVTDRCPCHHENPSNKRWCCGDQPHFDVSHEAFGELASHTGGWVYLQWREIQCPDAVGLGGDILHDPLNWTPHCNSEAGDDKTLADVAQDKGLTTFLEAVWRAGPDVWDALSTKAHQHSVIAPTNEAFADAAEAMDLSVEELLEEPALSDIVKYHFLKDVIDFEDGAATCTDVQPDSGNTCEQEKSWGKCRDYLEENGFCSKTCGTCQPLDTMADMPMTLSVSAEDNATIVVDRGLGPLDTKITTIEPACNGNLAIADSVLFSLCKSDESKGLLQVAQEAGLLHFTEAVWKANILSSDSLGIGNEYGLYTVFAPTDGAFEESLQTLGFQNFTEFLNSEDLVSIMENHVIKGNQHVGYFEHQCHDLAVPKEIIDMIPTASSWINSTVGCEEIETLGFCANDWIATGYCRETCGRCQSRDSNQEDIVYSVGDRALTLLQSQINAWDQLRVFNVEDNQPAVVPPQDAFRVNIALDGSRANTQSTVIVPDLQACNGLLNIVDSVLF